MFRALLVLIAALLLPLRAAPETPDAIAREVLAPLLDPAKVARRLMTSMGEAAAVAEAEPGGDGVVDDVAVGVNGALEGDGVGGFVVTQQYPTGLLKIEKTSQSFALNRLPIALSSN